MGGRPTGAAAPAFPDRTASRDEPIVTLKRRRRPALLPLLPESTSNEHTCSGLSGSACRPRSSSRAWRSHRTRLGRLLGDGRHVPPGPAEHRRPDDIAQVGRGRGTDLQGQQHRRQARRGVRHEQWGPPFTVNRAAKVTNLNADQIDGLDSLAFLQISTVFGGDVAGPFADLQLGDGVVGTNQLADGSVTSAKVLDDTLSATDIATNGVNSAEIATDAVAATEIQNDSIDSGEIVDFGLSNQDIGVLFAEVQANGTLDNSSGGGVTVTKLGGTGNYEVDFARTITTCTAVATVGAVGRRVCGRRGQRRRPRGERGSDLRRHEQQRRYGHRSAVPPDRRLLAPNGEPRRAQSRPPRLAPLSSPMPFARGAPPGGSARPGLPAARNGRRRGCPSG